MAIALHIVLPGRMSMNGVGNNVRPVVVHHIVVLPSHNMAMAIANDVVMMVNVCATR